MQSAVHPELVEFYLNKSIDSSLDMCAKTSYSTFQATMEDLDLELWRRGALTYAKYNNIIKTQIQSFSM